MGVRSPQFENECGIALAASEKFTKFSVLNDVLKLTNEVSLREFWWVRATVILGIARHRNGVDNC